MRLRRLRLLRPAFHIGRHLSNPTLPGPDLRCLLLVDAGFLLGVPEHAGCDVQVAICQHQVHAIALVVEDAPALVALLQTGFPRCGHAFVGGAADELRSRQVLILVGGVGVHVTVALHWRRLQHLVGLRATAGSGAHCLPMPVLQEPHPVADARAHAGGGRCELGLVAALEAKDLAPGLLLHGEVLPHRLGVLALADLHLVGAELGGGGGDRGAGAAVHALHAAADGGLLHRVQVQARRLDELHRGLFCGAVAGGVVDTEAEHSAHGFAGRLGVLHGTEVCHRATLQVDHVVIRRHVRVAVGAPVEQVQVAAGGQARRGRDALAGILRLVEIGVVRMQDGLHSFFANLRGGELRLLRGIEGFHAGAGDGGAAILRLHADLQLGLNIRGRDRVQKAEDALHGAVLIPQVLDGAVGTRRLRLIVQPVGLVAGRQQVAGLVGPLVQLASSLFQGQLPVLALGDLVVVGNLLLGAVPFGDVFGHILQLVVGAPPSRLFALEVIPHGRQVGQDVVPLHPALVGALEDVDALELSGERLLLQDETAAARLAGLHLLLLRGDGGAAALVRLPQLLEVSVEA
mmetsp:Transcript_136038/g.322365  ORF Transcript_136038/g.322365 Transcript_136038/m.322365 type:complete len:574 (-) Transcript_136038:446-2167(-)